MNILDSSVYAFNDPTVIREASNIKKTENPLFTIGDFYSFYPQFQGLDELPESVIQLYLDFALDVVNIAKWGNQFKIGVCLFTAHFITLYLMSATPEGANAQEVLNSAQMRGVISSKSVHDVSVSYDYSLAISDVDKWGNFSLTIYGNQFVNLAKMIGKGGMYIW